MFRLKTDFAPCGDQPQAIDGLVSGLDAGKHSQVLLGVTGSGKTFTMANVIAKMQRPTLILAHNKTLAAQLYQEFKNFFPDNAVEYFVSYYDYYQPEAYIPRTDTYIEKDMAINDRIDRLRLSATRALLERQDVVIVASVSCIYGLGMPEYYSQMRLSISLGETIRHDELLLRLVAMQYVRNDVDFCRGTFRVRGDILEIFPADEEVQAIRIEFFGEDVDRISTIDSLTGKVIERVETITIYPGSHHVTPEEIRSFAFESIRAEMEERVTFFEERENWVAAQRIRERTLYDLEMMEETGSCKGIENYSRHFSRRNPGQPPPCLLDYFPEDFIVFVDESHQTIPQLNAMYNGDKARKNSLIEFGFRLPSAYDNRPLQFDEFYERLNQVVYVSATPGSWEINESQGTVIEQIIRPTGLLDPQVIVRPATDQVDDCLNEIKQCQGKVLVTTLTKRLAEDFTSYLQELGIKASYLHSDVDTLERIQIIQALRRGEFDVLVGINLLREGLDIPEVSLVAIFDADKEGFLRSTTSLLQTCGRAARNINGRVIMYADKMTSSIKTTVNITENRRQQQHQYNIDYNITPKSIKRDIANVFAFDEPPQEIEEEHLTSENIEQKIQYHQKQMTSAAQKLQFDIAAHHRDLMRQYQSIQLCTM